MNVQGGTIDGPPLACANQYVPKTGRPKMPTNEAQARGERIKSLREQLHLSQDEFAKRSGLQNRTYVSKFESGTNKATSFEALSALARGFGLTLQEMKDYLSGTFVPVIVHEIAAPIAVADSARLLATQRNKKETVSERTTVAVDPPMEGTHGHDAVSGHAKTGTRKHRVRG
jgi:transcriptional regulator with XRE-family HTH domain